MAKVVFVDWRDRVQPPEIVGVFENEDEGQLARGSKIKELVEEGYDNDEEVRVEIEDVNIISKNILKESEVELVKKVLADVPNIVSEKLADTIEDILRSCVG